MKTRLVTKRLLQAGILAAAFMAGSASATLIATPGGPFDQLDDAFTAEIYSGQNNGVIGLAWLPDGRLVRSTGGNGLYIHSATADTTVNGANTLHSATLQGVSGAGISGHGLTLGLDGNLYHQSNQGLVRINTTTFVATVVAGTMGGTYGIKTLSNGKIAYNGNDGWVHLYDPSANTDSAIYNSGNFNDDLAVTPDGYIAVAVLGACQTRIINQSGVVINTQSSAHCADGMAYGQGKIYKNNTDGTLTRLVFSGPNYSGSITEELVATWSSGIGQYGDLAGVGPDNAFYIDGYGFDYPNGSPANPWTVVRIFLTDGGGGFGAPAPATLLLFCLGLLGLGARRSLKTR